MVDEEISVGSNIGLRVMKIRVARGLRKICIRVKIPLLKPTNAHHLLRQL